MRITVEIQNPENFERVLQTLPSGKVKIFGIEWGIQKSYLAAPFEASLDLFSSDPIKIEVITKS